MNAWTTGICLCIRDSVYNEIWGVQVIGSGYSSFPEISNQADAQNALNAALIVGTGTITISGYQVTVTLSGNARFAGYAIPYSLDAFVSGGTYDSQDFSSPVVFA